MSGPAAVIGTLGLLLIVHGIIIGAEDFTRGSNAFRGVPRTTGMWTALAFALLAIVAARLYRESVPGVQLRASREDELAARSIGVDIMRRRLGAWVISAVICAARGRAARPFPRRLLALEVLLRRHAGAADHADRRRA